MIWPADVSAWLVDLTSATGQMKGMMILAGISLWYSVAIGSAVALGGALVEIFEKYWREWYEQRE